MMKESWINRFFSKVEKTENGCWTWTGSTTSSGYGKFRVGPKEGTGRRTVQAHRWLYEKTKKEIPSELVCDHICRKRNCVNPDHIEIVTVKQNTQRGLSGDLKEVNSHCKYGHELTEDNTYRPPSRPTKRQCRECRRRRNIEHRNRLRKKA